MVSKKKNIFNSIGCFALLCVAFVFVSNIFDPDYIMLFQNVNNNNNGMIRKSSFLNNKNIVLPYDYILAVVLYQCVFLFISVQIQDLRDIKGDSAAERKTCPIVYGMRNTRFISCMVVVLDMIRCIFQILYIIYFSNYDGFYFKNLKYWYGITYYAVMILTEIYMIYRLLLPLAKPSINVERYDHYSYLLIIVIYFQIVFSASTLS